MCCKVGVCETFKRVEKLPCLSCGISEAGSCRSGVLQSHGTVPHTKDPVIRVVSKGSTQTLLPAEREHLTNCPKTEQDRTLWASKLCVVGEIGNGNSGLNEENTFVNSGLNEENTFVLLP